MRKHKRNRRHILAHKESMIKYDHKINQHKGQTYQYTLILQKLCELSVLF